MTADAAREPGTIVTFYSYKGGTGRSMALANLAWLAARETAPGRVLMIDWDLEAPGLHRYFPESETPDNAERPGLIDYFIRLVELLTPDTYEALSRQDGAAALDALLPLDDFITPDVGPSLDLIRAGRMDRDYAHRIAAFDWAGLFTKYHRVYRSFRELLAARYGWCFVDSRTGLSDTSGACTMLMPERLVTVFTPNRQSVDGVIGLAVRAIEYRRASDDPRPLSVFPLPSRIVTEEHRLLQSAQDRYRRLFENCLRTSYELAACDLGLYFEEVAIPHKSYYGFNEAVALRDDPSATDALSINRAYERFYRRLVTLDAPWDRLPDTAEAPGAPPPRPPDAAWARGVLSDAGFDSDVYISYAHIDDATLSTAADGFVGRLERDLKTRLEQYLGTSVRIWRPERLMGNDVFADVIVESISRCAVFVTVSSPRYWASDWCRRELEQFLAADKERVKPASARSRVFLVEKLPVSRDQIPGELASTLGYQFFRYDESGRMREFFVDTDPREYLLRLDDLAHDISTVLTEIREGKGGMAASELLAQRTVYLAEATTDVAQERDQLRRELVAHGHRVVPVQQLPLTPDYVAAAREELARADLSIHLIGGRRGVVPEGETRSIVELQCEIALQAGKRCLVWIAPGSGETPVHRIVEQAGRSDAEIVSANIQDFKAMVVDALAGVSRRAVALPQTSRQVYVLHDLGDQATAQELAEHLTASKVEVTFPLFSGDPSEIRQDRRETLLVCDAVILVWGSASEAWLRTMIRELRKVSPERSSPLPSAVFLAPPFTDAKERFSPMSGAIAVRGSSVAEIDPFVAQLRSAAQS